MLYDVIVVGGSYAGMAAALQVARARRQVLVIDSGLRRNRFASHAHGFLGQDGTPHPRRSRQRPGRSSLPIRTLPGSTVRQSTTATTAGVFPSRSRVAPARKADGW